MAHPTGDTDHILEAAFDKAFSPPPSRRQSMQPPPPKAPTEATSASVPDPTPAPEETQAAPSTESSSLSAEDPWKLEYEEQVKAWRAQSAEAREKAEKVREQWEARRAAEHEELTGTSREPEVIPGPGHASVSQVKLQDEGGEKEVKAEEKTRDTIVEGPPSPVGLVSGGGQRRADGSASSTLARMGSQPDTIDGSQRWEEINSLTSSYPSISFPEQAAPSHPHPPPQAPPQSVTLSVFDSSLSTRTRLKALASSLAINLVLPFVNGVMLGFGEIFAKNFILGWLGWGSTATTVGITQRQRFNQPAFR